MTYQKNQYVLTVDYTPEEYEALPENARRYVEFLERQIACPIRMVSNGPRREEIIRR